MKCTVKNIHRIKGEGHYVKVRIRVIILIIALNDKKVSKLI